MAEAGRIADIAEAREVGIAVHSEPVAQAAGKDIAMSEADSVMEEVPESQAVIEKFVAEESGVAFGLVAVVGFEVARDKDILAVLVG
jgi:hypothetical protein